MQLTPRQRYVLEQMAEGQELTEAIPGGWWLEEERIGGQVGWALLRMSLISQDKYTSDGYHIYVINEWGRKAIKASPRGTAKGL